MLPKTSSGVSGTYNRENITTVIHDVTEYSEIPEDSKTTYYEVDVLINMIDAY